MSDASQQRIVLALQSIAASMKEQTRVLATLNENFVAFVKKFDQFDSISMVDVAQMTLDDPPKEDERESTDR